MSKLLRKDWFAAAALAMIMGGISVIAAQLLIRHLSLFLAGEPQFCRIFQQLLDARLGIPLWLLLPAFGISWTTVKLIRGKRRFWAGCLMIFGGLLLLLCALYCTPVNGILFGDVMASLLDVLGKGGLDGL